MPPDPVYLLMTSSLPCSCLKHKTTTNNWTDTWPIQQITWTCWNPSQLCASCLWSWTSLYLPQRPVKGYLALQDLSSAQEEQDEILAISKNNFFWRWTANLSVSSNYCVVTVGKEERKEGGGVDWRNRREGKTGLCSLQSLRFEDLVFSFSVM